MISISIEDVKNEVRREAIIDELDNLVPNDVEYVATEDADIWIDMADDGPFEVYISGTEFGFEGTEVAFQNALGLIAGVAFAKSPDGP